MIVPWDFPRLLPGPQQGITNTRLPDAADLVRQATSELLETVTSNPTDMGVTCVEWNLGPPSRDRVSQGVPAGQQQHRSMSGARAATKTAGPVSGGKLPCLLWWAQDREE
ncbi:hypothetical protein GCM10018965_034520 [Nonomuraea roseola]